MKRMQVVEAIYNDYFFSDRLPEYSIPFISSNTHLLWLVRSLQHSKLHSSMDSYAKSSVERLQDLINRKIEMHVDELSVDKLVFHTNYNWFASLQRLLIVELSLSNDLQLKLLGLSIGSIYRISCIIILRVLVYNSAKLDGGVVAQDTLNKLLGCTNASFWFTPHEIITLDPSIVSSDLDKYLNLFSQEIEAIVEGDFDIATIYKESNMYSVIFIDDFTSFVFSKVERLITERLKQYGNQQLEDYKKLRGKFLEASVANILKQVFNPTHKNLIYQDINQKKREIDVLFIGDVIIAIECKSSYFNIFEHSNSAETIIKLHGAFEKSLVSINALIETLEKKGSIDLYQNRRKVVTISSKTPIIPIQVTLYPIDVIGTHLQNFDPTYEDKYKYYPININFIDFFTIIYLAFLNNKPVMDYFHRRYHLINKLHDLDLDIDELSVLGLFSDPQNEPILENIEIWGEMRKLIFFVGDEYRNACNEIIGDYGLEVLLKDINFEQGALAEQLFKYDQQRKRT